MTPIELTIKTTWDSKALEVEDFVTLAISKVEDQLEVLIKAPFYKDPKPKRKKPGSTWELWENEVVELFILGPHETYTEFEFGPYGHYLVLKLKGVRKIMERELPLQYQAHIDGNRWEAKALIPLSYLPKGPHFANAYAMHGIGNNRQYNALYPMNSFEPDFHQLEVFQEIKI